MGVQGGPLRQAAKIAEQALAEVSLSFGNILERGKLVDLTLPFREHSLCDALQVRGQHLADFAEFT
jgi:hypothetical protein